VSTCNPLCNVPLVLVSAFLLIEIFFTALGSHQILSVFNCIAISHNVYILTQFHLSISHLSLYINKLPSKFSTQRVQLNCAIELCNWTVQLNCAIELCNWTVRSSGSEQYFKVIHSSRAYSIKIKPRRNVSQTKYIFTNSLKQLLVSTRFKYPSPVCAQKEVKIEINPLNSELNPICHLLALLGPHHILHVSRLRVNWLPKQQ